MESKNKRCCNIPPGVTIKPDGVHQLESLCVFNTEEVYRNVTLAIRKCQKCGRIDLAWWRQENTEEIPPEEATFL